MSLLEVPPRDPEARTLVDELLDEQRSLTAVERFSRVHDHGIAPAQQKFYRDLIPLSLPAPGEQYAFEVDLDKCSGCKACVTACHAMNGLDDEESWRDVGLLHSEDWRAPFQAHVTTACHHCVEPGCLEGCPVLAYDKDPVTGIVRHLDDQCIGCQYCVMKCPYDVPKYSAARGIVRKCDMCSTRLGHGEAPACVQACPSQAIRITLVNQQETSAHFRDEMQNTFLPASPAPRFTIPTTRYKSAKPLPANIVAGDHAQVTPADPHLPLVFMLVLSQLAVGASTVALFDSPGKWLALFSFVACTTAMVCGTLHLGQPLKAWRCFLGWRASWFSREVIAFAVYLAVSALNVASFWNGWLAPFREPLTWLAALTGIAAVGCSAMIYADTHREFWRASQSLGKFFGTTSLLGCAAALVFALAFHNSTNGNVTLLTILVCIILMAKLGFENRIARHWVDDETPSPTPLNKTARLLDGELGKIARRRIACGATGGVVIPILLALNAASPAVTTLLAFLMFALCLLGELMERYLFFTAVAPAKMPGGVLA